MALKINIPKVSVGKAVGNAILEHEPSFLEVVDNVVEKIFLEELTEAEALTQEYMILWKKLEEIGGKKLLARMEDLRKSLQSIANEEDPDQPIAFASAKGSLVFSARTKVLEIHDLLDLWEHLSLKFGVVAALSVMKVSITDLRKMLSENEIKKWADEKLGGRILKSVLPAGG